jgi:hypothetical protein
MFKTSATEPNIILRVVQATISVQLLDSQDPGVRDDGIYWYRVSCKWLCHSNFYGSSCRWFLLCLVYISCPKIWTSSIGSDKQAAYLRTEIWSSLRNVILHENMAINNAHKSNHCPRLLFNRSTRVTSSALWRTFVRLSNLPFIPDARNINCG